MKKLILIILVLFSCTLVAQSGPRKSKMKAGDAKEEIKDWSPEQRAELKTKKMALHLDLTEAQQNKIYAIELEIAKNRLAMKEKRAEKKELSSDERYEAKKKMLDAKLQIKEQYKSVLTAEQFEKWQKTHKRRKGRKSAKLEKNKN
tara:strand:+ start:166864 stop:167301 length:438 start_codon:yes stop_codon:yes gene_type:complete